MSLTYDRGLVGVRYDSGPAFPSDPIDGDTFHRTDLDEVFFYDAGRAKWLSYWVETARWSYFASLANGMSYIEAAQAVVNSYGYQYPYDMQIVGFRVSTKASSTCTWAIYTNATLGPTVAMSAAVYAADTTMNTALSAGSILTLFCLNTAATSHNAEIYLRRTAT